MIFDAIVVGAGPAGSASAALLAAAGLRVLLMDRGRFPRPKPCGDYVNPGGVAALDRLGAGPAVRRAGTRVPGMRIVGPRGTAAPARFSCGEGRAITRAALDHLLIQHAARAGAAVIEDTRAVEIVQERRHLRIRTERGGARNGTDAYAARLVVGADGLRSAVARMTGAGGPPTRGRFAVGGYLEGLVPEAGDIDAPLGELHLARDRYCGVAFLPGGLANVTVALGPGQLRAWRGRLEAGYWATLHSLPGLGLRLGRVRLAGPLRASGPLGFWRRRAAGPGVILVGDAAAFIDPMTGQGVYLAVRGAELAAQAAARALDTGGPTAANLAPYERGRRQAFQSAFVLSRALERLAFCGTIADRALRRMAVRPRLGGRFIDAIGGAAPAISAFRPALLAGLLGV